MNITSSIQPWRYKKKVPLCRNMCLGTFSWKIFMVKNFCIRLFLIKSIVFIIFSHQNYLLSHLNTVWKNFISIIKFFEYQIYWISTAAFMTPEYEQFFKKIIMSSKIGWVKFSISQLVSFVLRFFLSPLPSPQKTIDESFVKNNIRFKVKSRN